jgi:hypothetical protein
MADNVHGFNKCAKFELAIFPPPCIREILRCCPYLFIFFCFLRFAHNPNEKIDFHG